MDLESPAAFFRRLVAGRALPADDPADLGTAYGLDASLGPANTDFARDGTPGTDPKATEEPMTWLARRLQRPR